MTCAPEGGGILDTATACPDGNSTVCGLGKHCFADIVCDVVPTEGRFDI